MPVTSLTKRFIANLTVGVSIVCITYFDSGDFGYLYFATVYVCAATTLDLARKLWWKRKTRT
ncbi:hypothetical protein CBW46_012205 [Paenibacillus xerothermodurans]|uniref:Uncharacterized protein n=1 Tax=Paenibacillus xerothermodurans TaxID=1977292 RepID=A0A2W1NBQ5_PAEXE|nr:hypothetical protein CBW46_012205 [Paenibacillus xerothermodurans]